MSAATNADRITALELAIESLAGIVPSPSTESVVARASAFSAFIEEAGGE